MKSKIAMTLFALPFFGFGVWMFWSISGVLYQSWQMQDWVEVEAKLGRGGYETHRGDDSDTYQAYADYSYSYGGQRYSGNRVSLSEGADNIGEFQENTGRRLQNAAANGVAIVIYVKPEAPHESIIDPNIRWGLIGFKAIFVFVFGSVGLGLLIFVWRRKAAKDASRPEFVKSPWLLNDNWQSATIRSSSKTAMWAAWAFATFWNLISAALPFVVYQEVTRKDNYIALLGLLFPLVGIGLLTWAIRRTLEWRRFGAAPVTLDPFPGSIGGHVGGTIDLKLPFDAAAQFRLTLNNLHSYISGSGKNRSRKETAKWQESIVAHAQPGASGTRLVFRFDVPDGLEPSDTDQDDSYYLWKLNLAADLPGTDLDRVYEIPVYATGVRSRYLSDMAVRKAQAEQRSIDSKAVGEIVEIRNGPDGKQLRYPAGRHIGSSLIGLIVGSTFAAVGWYLGMDHGQAIFGSIFGGIGALVATFSLYAMLNSLEVSSDGGALRSVRRLLGIPISHKQMRHSNFERLKKKSTMQSHSGSKHVVYYSVYAVDRNGNEMILGEGFKGENEVTAAMRIIGDALHLDPIAGDFE